MNVSSRNHVIVPFPLSNGRDLALMNYSGSMFTGLTGHAHYEQLQNAVCGFYKCADASQKKVLQASCMTGYQVIIDGEVCDPVDFEQEFVAREATLRTTISFRLGCRVSVESFLTESGILVERYEVLEVPAGSNVDIALVMLKPNSVNGTCTTFTQPEVSFTVHDSWLSIDYSMYEGQVRGSGFMASDLCGEPVEYCWGTSSGLLFKSVSVGWCNTKYVCLEDSCDGEAYLSDLEFRRGLIVLGYGELHRRHVENWGEYFGTSSFTCDDLRLQDMWELSRYIVRAVQHVETGALTLGSLPYLWGGGTCVPCDAMTMHWGMLLAGNVKEGEDYVDFYANRLDEACQDAQDMGVAGAVYSGWSDCFGHHKQERSLKEHILFEKPMMMACIGISAARQIFYGGANMALHGRLLHEILSFFQDRFIHYQDGRLVFPCCMAGNESEVAVENDTFTLITVGRLFRDAGEVFQDDSLKKIASDLEALWQQNYDENRVLQPYAGAKYTAGLQSWTFIYNLPQGISRESIEKQLKATRTPWGYDNDQPSEYYRLWPWHNMMLGMCLAHLQEPVKSQQVFDGCFDSLSDNGAWPEKIRLDGFPIGYWYPTLYGTYLVTLASRLAHVNECDELCILYGFSGPIASMSIRNLMLRKDLKVSFEVRDSKVVKVDVQGGGSDLVIHINPKYR